MILKLKDAQKNHLTGQKGDFLHETSCSLRFVLAKISQPLAHHVLVVLGIAAYNILGVSPDLTAQTNHETKTRLSWKNTMLCFCEVMFKQSIFVLRESTHSFL